MTGIFGRRYGRAETASLAMIACCLVSIGAARADALLGGANDDEEGSWSDNISQGFKKTFANVGKSVGLGSKPEGPPPKEAPSGCPTINVLDGTMSQRVMASGASGNQGVRYQFSLGNVGRQCSIAGNQVAIKVGADGRVLLGPAGAAGRFDVPIRVVVYSERQQKPVSSKLYRVSASVPSGQTGAPFQFVSDNIVVPNAGEAFREYSIKVGIDGSRGGDSAEPKSKRRKQKPVAAAASE